MLSMKRDAARTPSRSTPVSIPSPFEHVEQIFGREIAGRAGRVRAAAEAASRRVEGRDAEIERGEHVGERGAARVVEVQRDASSGTACGDGADDARHLAGWAMPIVSLTATSYAPMLDQRGRDRRDGAGCDGAFERAAERGRDVGADRDAAFRAPVAHGCDTCRATRRSSD